MYAFSKSLGDTVKAARNSLKYTQAQAADLIDAEVRTVMHIATKIGSEVVYLDKQVFNAS